MAVLDNETRAVQNPAFGAAVLAAFVSGFYENDATKTGVPLPYLYVALPMILHSDIYCLIRSTRPSLRHLAEKFVSVEYAGTDLLLSLHQRAIQMRKLTSECLGVMLATGLVDLNRSNARLVPRKVQALADRPETPDQSEQARKLGGWFAELSPFEIGSILKVTF